MSPLFSRKTLKMFSTAYFHLPCANPLLGKRYTGLVYGLDRPCRRCNGFHPERNQQLPESDKTEYMASKIAMHANAKSSMIGLLIAADGSMVATTSSTDGSQNRRLLIIGIRLSQYGNIAVAGDLDLTKPLPNAGGAAVAVDEREGCQPAGCPVPGQCAAPKLIAYAIANNLPRPYVMTEVWSERNQGDKERAFKANEPIESCYSCGSLVPLLMCCG
jgi:hypothetical protein